MLVYQKATVTNSQKSHGKYRNSIGLMQQQNAENSPSWFMGRFSETGSNGFFQATLMLSTNHNGDFWIKQTWLNPLE